MKLPIISLSAVIAVCAGMVSCSSTDNDNATNEITLSGDAIIIAPNSLILNRIETTEIKSTEYCPRFSASGQVKAIPARYAEVGVPFSGRIAKSFVRPGQKVQAGQPLFQISSGEYLEICRSAFEAATECDQAERAFSRASRLYESRMISAREYEEAKADYDIKKRAAENAAASLRVFGGDINSVAPGQPMTVKSPITGTVTVNNLVNGQYVKDDAEASVIVTDLDRVWVVANVKENDFSKLQNIDNVEVSIDSWADTTFIGKVYHINEILDPATRTVELIVECDNASGMLKPNMFGTVHLTDGKTEAILVNTAAIRRHDDHAYVVKSLGNNSYVNCFVETGESVDGFTIIKSGVAEGDVIVTNGAFYLPEMKIDRQS